MAVRKGGNKEKKNVKTEGKRKMKQERTKKKKRYDVGVLMELARRPTIIPSIFSICVLTRKRAAGSLQQNY